MTTRSSSPELRRPPPPGLQKSLSRRVSFNEATFATRVGRPPSSVDTESQASTSAAAEAARRRSLALCGSCCAWASILVSVFLTLFLFLGGIYFAFLQSNLPEVRLHRLDVNRLNVSGDTVTQADFSAWLNVTNGSGKFELRYRGLGAAISASGVSLGRARLDDMRQRPHGMADVQVQTTARDVAAEAAAAAELEGDYERRMMLVSVVVRGRIEFFLGGTRMSGMPFKIDCHSIDQADIDQGKAPTCNTKLSLF